MYDMDTFIMILRIGENQSFGADQLPTQIADLSSTSVLPALLSPFENPVSTSSDLGVTEVFCLVVWGFFTFPLGPFKNSSLDIAGMETRN